MITKNKTNNLSKARQLLIDFIFFSFATWLLPFALEDTLVEFGIFI